MRVVFPMLFVLCVAGCSTPSSPSQPVTQDAAAARPTTGNPGPQVPTGSASVSGVVVEDAPDGERPLAGASVNAWIQRNSTGYSHWYANGSKRERTATLLP